MDWSFVHKAWEKWAFFSVGSSGEPLTAALLINYDPTGPSRMLSTIAEQEGTKSRSYRNDSICLSNKITPDRKFHYWLERIYGYLNSRELVLCKMHEHVTTFWGRCYCHADKSIHLGCTV